MYIILCLKRILLFQGNPQIFSGKSNYESELEVTLLLHFSYLTGCHFRKCIIVKSKQHIGSATSEYEINSVRAKLKCLYLKIK